MKDVFFNDYKKNGSSRRPNGELDEHELEERLNRRRFDEIMENQRRAAELSPDEGAPEHVRDGDNYRYEHPETPEEPKKKKKKRGCGCGCGSAFLCFILVIALIAGGSLGYLWILCGKPQYNEPAENRYISEASLDYNTLVKNYLLIGSDKDSENTSRSDTLLLVSIDTAHNKIKVTSVMRDMWVQIPDHNKAKLNASYAYGGAALVKDTIEYNFHIRIDGYFTVDFEMFKKLIDALGGVTVDITDKEAEFINRTTHAKVSPGTNTLNGDYALIYCRIRKLDSDFMR
ncbi:MAG: LCP family protein, partial [Clostridia bacterium]|nr:LCP family protein [Clostridia bacterium]